MTCQMSEIKTWVCVSGYTRGANRVNLTKCYGTPPPPGKLLSANTFSIRNVKVTDFFVIITCIKLSRFPLALSVRMYV
jgi:hypothetical protein